MSQPVWFNKRLPLKGLAFNRNPTHISKWAPLASLDVSTLRDMWCPDTHWWHQPKVLASWVYLCLPHENNPSFRRRVKMRAKELLKLLHPMERGVVKAGPATLKKGNYAITDQGVIGNMRS